MSQGNSLHGGWIIACVLVVMILIVTNTLSYWIGKVVGNIEAYDVVFSREEKEVNSIIRGQPAYSGIKIRQQSIGYATLEGAVDSEEDYKHLTEKMHETFGTFRHKQRMSGVHISP